MGGHIVRSLVAVSVQRVSIWDEPIKECVEIVLYIWICIFLDDQRGGCVMQKNMAHTNLCVG